MKVRDYIYALDLENGHAKALKALDYLIGVQIYNFGTRLGYSVLEIIDIFVKVIDIPVSYEAIKRRDGYDS